jgi:hypothetical protein
MKKSLLYLLFAGILFSSCKDEEAPQSFLNATYEKATENTDTGIWYVSQYIFHSNGTFEQLFTKRDSKAGDDLGFAGYYKGTYSLRGEDFNKRMTEWYSVNHEEFPEGYVERLEDLEAQSMSAQFIESKGTLKRLDGGEKIALLFECNDVIGHSAICIGEEIFDRVD